jgi:hypothetical protein
MIISSSTEPNEKLEPNFQYCPALRFCLSAGLCFSQRSKILSANQTNMNLIPIVGFGILGLIALHLAYKLGAYRTNRKVLRELKVMHSDLRRMDESIGSISTLFVRHLSDLASQPKKTTKTSSRKAAKSLKN